MANKNYLDQEGLERLVRYINDALNNKADVGAIPADVALKSDLEDYVKANDNSYIDENELATELASYATTASLADYATNASLADVVREADLDDYATNDDLDNLKTSLATVYHYRGSVADLAALEAIENPEVGDVYNLADTGMNAGWTGEVWDYFGSVVDLTDYLTENEVNAIAIPVVDSILYGGKSAVINDENGLKAMLANEEAEVEISLADDMVISDNIAIPAGKKVVLDLGDNKVSIASGKQVVVRGEMEINGGEDGELDAGNWGLTAYGEGAKLVLNSGHLEAGEAPIAVQQGAQFVMNGGELEGRDNCPLMGQGSEGQGNVDIVINGGKLIAHITSAGYIACGVYMPNSGKFTMNGGEIVSDGAGLVMRAGEVELNGGSIVANGATGIKGKVGDSRVVVGPYAVIYDEKAKYPGASEGEFKLTIGEDMILEGTDGDLDFIFSDDMDAAAQEAYKAEHFVDNR